MKTLRVILVMPESPLPFGNADSRWYYVLIRSLAELGHSVTAFAACTTTRDRELTRECFPSPHYDVRPYTHDQQRGTLLRKWNSFTRPYSYVFSRELRTDLENEIQRGCDILHLEQLWSGWLGLSHAERALINLHYLFEIDLASAPVSGITGRALRYATRRGERRLLRHYPHIATLTPRLSARVRQIAPAAGVHTVPIALDLSLYPFDPAVPDRSTAVVALIGSFNWHPTRTAGLRLVERLWPRIRDRVPEANLRLVGRHARSVLGRFQGTPGVSIHENVPDILPYFDESDVMLYAPTEGSGIKVKVLEAFALGVPVVTTPDGVEGMPATDGVHAGIAPDDEGLVERTVALLRNPALRLERRLAARALLEEHCAPSRVLSILQQVYGSILGVA